MSFTINSDDISGFITAQAQLRDQLGAVATFYTPTAPTWPDGTAINPDTGVPFDSTVVQSNDDFTAENVTVLIIAKQGSPLRPQADTYFNESGARLGADIILDVAPSDYDDYVASATWFTVDGIDYSIEEHKPFSLGTTIYRYLTYGAAR